MAAERIGLIAGSGRFPVLFAETAARRGVEVIAVAHRGETAPELERVVSRITWVHPGELEAMIQALRDAGVERTVLVGGIAKPNLFRNVRPDARALSLLARVGQLRDDLVLRAVAGELEGEGIAVVPSTVYLEEIVPAAGVLGGREPTDAEWNDIRFGFEAAKVIGQFDIGQSVVVRSGAIVAVEGIEGTDATIRRAGQLANGDIVLVKVCKPTQDTRFDLPAIGPDTIRVLANVGGRALAVEAGRTITLDRPELIARADAAGIAVVAVDPASMPGRPGGRAAVVSELRAAVIGAGYLGRFHAQKYAAHPGVRLVAVVDVDAARAGNLAKELGVESVTDHRAVLGRVDCASVVVPTQHHHAVARDLLEAGIDVLVEKPLTHTVEEGKKLLELAVRRERVLQVGHLERFNPAVVALDGLVSEPRFIECHRLAPFSERGTDVDVILDLMIHDLDVILSLVPSAVRSIDAVGVPVLSSSVDIANARIRFANGCIANLTASRVSLKRERKLRIFQPDAYVTVDYGERRVRICRREPGDDGQAALVLEDREVRETDALEVEIDSFVQAVRRREPPQVTGWDGLRALEVAHVIRESLATEARAVDAARTLRIG